MAARRGPGCCRRGRRTSGGRGGLWLAALAALFAAVAPAAAGLRIPNPGPTAWVTQTGGFCTSPDRKCITFVSALTEPCYDRIQLLSNVSLTAADFSVYDKAPYLLERDLAIVGAPGRFPQIDFNFLTTRVIMAKGVTVRFDSLRLTNPRMSAGLGIDLFGGRQDSAIVIQNADRFRFAALDAMEVCSVAEGYPRPKRFPGPGQIIEQPGMEMMEMEMEMMAGGNMMGGNSSHPSMLVDGKASAPTDGAEAAMPMAGHGSMPMPMAASYGSMPMAGGHGSMPMGKDSMPMAGHGSMPMPMAASYGSMPMAGGHGSMPMDKDSMPMGGHDSMPMGKEAAMPMAGHEDMPMGSMPMDDMMEMASCNATHPVDMVFVDVAFRVNATAAGAAFGDEGYDMAIVNMTRSCFQVIPQSCYEKVSRDKCLYDYTMAHIISLRPNKTKSATPAGAAGGLSHGAIAGVAIGGAAVLALLALAMLAVGRWRGGVLERRKAGSLDHARPYPRSGPLEEQLRPEQGWALTSFVVAPDLANATAQDKIEFGPMLGRGSFGTVYRGVWQGLQAAIKVVPHSARQMCDDILSEAKLLLSLNHPNVIKAYTVAQWKNSHPNEPTDSAMDQNEVRQDISTKSTPNPTGGASKVAPAGKGARWGFVKSALHRPFGGRSEALAAPADVEFGSRQSDQSRVPSRPTRLSVGSSSWAVSAGAGPRDLSSDGSVDLGAETWLITEYCSGGSLQQAASAHQLLNGVDGLPNQVTILCILRDVACGLAYLHDQSVCHADLKADNVLLAHNPSSRCGLTAKLGDLGLSRTLGANQTHASTRTFGTVTHMPPELLTTGKLSARGDVYALGILIWEAWTATAAFAGMAFPEVFAAVAVQQARPPVPADMPAPLVRLMCSCWAQEPTERPDAEQVVAALDGMLADLGHDTGLKYSGV